MNDALGNAVGSFTEQSVKAIEAAYDVICLKQTTTTQPPTMQTTEQTTTQAPETTTTPEPTTGSVEQDRINKRTQGLLRRYNIFTQSTGDL